MFNRLKYVMIVNEAGTLVASYPTEGKYKDQLLSNMLRALQDAFTLITKEKVSEVSFERMSAYIFELNDFMVVLVFEKKNPNEFNKWLRNQAIKELGDLFKDDKIIVESIFISQTEEKIGEFFNEYNTLVELISIVQREFLKYRNKYGIKAVRIMDGFIEKEGVLKYVSGVPELNIEELNRRGITLKEINKKLTRLSGNLQKLDEEETPFKMDKYAQAPF